MFLDEARLAARIRHPNVVPTLDIVAMAGELFLVMDFVQGESLARLMRTMAARGERIPPAMVATIMVGVLHGLHAAHEAKSEHGDPLLVVHRDVSPHNVLVGTDGVARVLDFGVAKAAGRVQTTREGQLKGKLAYMAPEQIRGAVTRVTDVYAASVVLWEALTGTRLFRGDHEGQVLDRILAGCDVPPSKYATLLPRGLDAVTMRGLSVDPAKRFPTARDMARAIESTLALATASTLGDWVEETAKETLDARSARVASIESDSSLYRQPGQKPRSVAIEDEPEAPPPSVQTQASMPVAVTDDMILAQLSSASISPWGNPSSSETRPRTKRISAVGVGLVLVTGVALVIARRSTTASSVTSAPPPSASSPVLVTATTSASRPRGAQPTIVAATSPANVPEPSASALPAVTAPPTVSTPDVASSLPRDQAARPPITTPASHRAKRAYDPLEHL
jgi:serine/threonine protein kinase